MDMKGIINASLILIALLNPISKISIIINLTERNPIHEINRVILKSSLIAMFILLSFSLAGNFILTELFHVDITSFKIAGGIILSLRGYAALEKGVFFELKDSQMLDEVSIVPIASPLIAGPATITAAVSLQPVYGRGNILAAIVIVVTLNALLMFMFETMGKWLHRFNIIGALIRITGLIVCTMGIHMITEGVRDFLTGIL